MSRYYAIRMLSALFVAGTALFAIEVCAADNFFGKIDVTAAVKISSYWKATLATESLWNDQGDQIRHYTDLGVVYSRIAKWFDIGANYRSVFRRIEYEEWIRENRYYLNLTARHRLLNLGFNHRIRFEYNQWNNRLGDFGTVRYRIGINPPIEFDPLRESIILKHYTYRPYGNYELAVNSLDYSIASHRFTLGLSFSFTKRIFSNLYYQYEIRQSEISDIDANFVGVSFKLLY